MGSSFIEQFFLFYVGETRIIPQFSGQFDPEFIGMLNFNLTAIDRLVKSDDDKATIGSLLWKNKEDVVFDFSF
jgi:hypothetical protein